MLKPQDDQLDFHTQHSVQTTSGQDLNPRPYTDNIHMCCLVHEMILIEPGENPTESNNVSKSYQTSNK